MNKEKIPAPPYIVGSEFTERLKEVTGCTTFGELSQMFDVPKATFSAWNLHNRTSHELIVRLHLTKGIPVEKLALGVDGLSVETGTVSQALRSNQSDIAIIKSFCLTNGKLLDTGDIPYSIRIFNSWNLSVANSIEIETNDGRYIVDKTQNDAVSGSYLIEINGRMSINHIQRLPNKLAIVFGNSTVEVKEEDIKVIGRVAVEVLKK
ncbi:MULTISPECIES: phage repressor protein CI [Vibrio]|uniref:phage repressor protein CI n=1 Tax=Vibrio TaxID=662 RepID=UPI0013025D62|nr:MULTISPECIES: phage repressor protein CI [Vibrio]WJG27671.1 phage repressor protein CI [Vibrio furnissii]